MSKTKNRRLEFPVHQAKPNNRIKEHGAMPRAKSQLHCLSAGACILICGFVAASPAAEAGWNFAFKEFPIGAFSPPGDKAKGI